MSDNDYKSNSSESQQLGGAKRKNGHKFNCSCHICENMKNKAKRGGYQEDMEKEELKKMGGSKKKNGHKPDCGCPICKNMKNKAKKGKRGGAEEDDSEEMVVEEIENEPFEGGRKKKGNGHKANCNCPICRNMKKSKRGGDDPVPQTEVIEENIKETVADDNDYDALVADEKSQSGLNVVGGTRKRRGSRRHMKKGRKTMRRQRKSSRRRH